MGENQKKLGRPKLPEDSKKKYQRTALYPETHALAKELQEKSGEKYLIDWFANLVKREHERTQGTEKKKFSLFKNK